MQILSPSKQHIALAAELLGRGELVAIPTETVYGLAGNAFDERALTRIFAAKERPTFDPLILHVAPAIGFGFVLDRLAALRLVDRSSLSMAAEKRIEALLEEFWPGPLTVVLPKHRDVPDLATSGLPTVAVRMPSHPVAQKIIAESGVPLAAPSANRFGRISPTRPEHVVAELEGRVEYVIDGGPCEVGLESTVVALNAEEGFSLLRPGGVAVSDIEKVLGQRLYIDAPRYSKSGEVAQLAPGMLQSHYAPRKKLTRLPGAALSMSEADWRSVSSPGDSAIGVLLYSGDESAAANALQALLRRRVIARSLSQKGDVTEAARLLFAKLRALDNSPAELLYCEPCTDESGLGYAIADRLRRASS